MTYTMVFNDKNKSINDYIGQTVTTDLGNKIFSINDEILGQLIPCEDYKKEQLAFSKTIKPEFLKNRNIFKSKMDWKWSIIFLLCLNQFVLLFVIFKLLNQ